jgi:hypothetical protein
MYKDIIHYQLAEGVSEKQLIQAAEKIINSWMKNQPGFVSWEITKSDQEYIDIVTWKSKETAKKAEQSMQTDLPSDNPWYACYDFSTIKSNNTNQIKKFTK